VFFENNFLTYADGDGPGSKSLLPVLIISPFGLVMTPSTLVGFPLPSGAPLSAGLAAIADVDISAVARSAANESAVFLPILISL